MGTTDGGGDETHHMYLDLYGEPESRWVGFCLWLMVLFLLLLCFEGCVGRLGVCLMLRLFSALCVCVCVRMLLPLCFLLFLLVQLLKAVCLRAAKRRMTVFLGMRDALLAVVSR